MLTFDSTKGIRGMKRLTQIVVERNARMPSTLSSFHKGLNALPYRPWKWTPLTSHERGMHVLSRITWHLNVTVYPACQVHGWKVIQVYKVNFGWNRMRFPLANVIECKVIPLVRSIAALKTVSLTTGMHCTNGIKRWPNHSSDETCGCAISWHPKIGGKMPFMSSVFFTKARNNLCGRQEKVLSSVILQQWMAVTIVRNAGKVYLGLVTWDMCAKGILKDKYEWWTPALLCATSIKYGNSQAVE